VGPGKESFLKKSLLFVLIIFAPSAKAEERGNLCFQLLAQATLRNVYIPKPYFVHRHPLGLPMDDRMSMEPQKAHVIEGIQSENLKVEFGQGMILVRDKQGLVIRKVSSYRPVAAFILERSNTIVLLVSLFGSAFNPHLGAYFISQKGVVNFFTIRLGAGLKGFGLYGDDAMYCEGNDGAITVIGRSSD